MRARLPAQNRVHLIAFEPGHRFSDGDLGQFGHQPLQDPAPDLGVRHFATAEEDGGLHLVAFFQEALDVLLLELVVVFVHLRTELDFLDLDDLLVLSSLARALLLLVLVLPEVHDPADGWDRSGGDLDEIEPFLLGDRERLRRRHDAELLARIVDDPDFPHADAFVGADAVVPAR